MIAKAVKQRKEASIGTNAAAITKAWNEIDEEISATAPGEARIYWHNMLKMYNGHKWSFKLFDAMSSQVACGLR